MAIGISHPDAVGPLTMDRLRDIVPDYYSEDGSEVFVYAPGVTIQTGLETADFVKAVANGNKTRFTYCHRCTCRKR